MVLLSGQTLDKTKATFSCDSQDFPAVLVSCFMCNSCCSQKLVGTINGVCSLVGVSSFTVPYSNTKIRWLLAAAEMQLQLQLTK